MLPLLKRLQNELDRRAHSKHLRAIATEQAAPIELRTNSYLQLHENPVLREAWQKKPSAPGNQASPLLWVQGSLYQKLCHTTARFKGTQACAVFSSGYAANVGSLQALCNSNTELFIDRLAHASLIDGYKLSGARLHRFNHNDPGHLETLLQKSRATEKVIVTESVFSMDGDMAPLKDLHALARGYGSLLFIDEAHATGLFGPGASGLAAELGVSGAEVVLMGTYSKALSGAGGYVAAAPLIVEWIINNARSLIYSTALPPATLWWNLLALGWVEKNAECGVALRTRAMQFCTALRERGFSLTPSASSIVAIVLGSNEAVLSARDFLFSKGIAVSAIRSPTVPRSTERLRLGLHTGVTGDDFSTIIKALEQWRGTC